MIKEIKYTGYTAVPSDYECPDGQLATCINLVPEDGRLKIISQPAVIMTLPSESQRVMYIHETTAYRHYIIYDFSSSKLSWIDSSDINPETLRPLNSHLMDSLPSGSIHQVTSIGNTLIALTPSGMFYFLWQHSSNAYASLGNRIPFPEISFALGVPVVDEPPSFDISISIPDTLKSYVQNTWLPGSGLSGDRRPVGPSARFQSAELSALIQDASNAVYAGLNSFITEAAHNGRFTQPFFIRYALRMFDGSHIMHSAPVLMIPNSSAPILPYIVNSDSSSGLFSAQTRIYHKACALFFRILTDSISQWSDIITHIDFYVSTPIYTFDQSGTIDPCHASHGSSTGFSHFGVYASSGSGGSASGDTGSSDAGTSDNTDNPPEDPFNNHRKPANPIAEAFYSFPDGNREMRLSQGSTMVWNISQRKTSAIEDDMLSPSASLFYLVSSIETAKVAPMTYFSFLPLEERSLSNLSTRPRLDDDYQSHHTLIPTVAYPFNSRLNVAGVSISPFPGFPIDSMAQCCIPAENSVQVSIAFHVRLRRNGVSCWTTLPSSSRTFPKAWLDSYFPRFLFYPDSSAVEMIMELLSNGVPSGYWTLPLSSHQALEGAYWFRGLGQSMPGFCSGQWSEEDGEICDNPILPAASKIYTSEVNNPFFFPVTGINTVGTGHVLGICSAAKALSQGQFGQFPLYAFTTDGIWAMEVSATGTFTARQPITRDVCVNPEGITQIDSAVLFPTERGIMLISGSQTQCISDMITDSVGSDIHSLPGMEKLHSMIGHDTDDSCLSIVPFLDFISGCGMVYDYPHQRIIVFNRDYSYAYVYSLKSKQWGMTYSRISHAVNSYPETFAVAKDCNLVDFSQENADRQKGLLVTRPVKLGEADVLKTVDSLMQRGIFRKGHVRSVLYGSRDMINWHLVTSSVSHRILNHRGTPYKYFRIALVCTLDSDENVCGCTVQYTPRFTNRIR